MILKHLPVISIVGWLSPLGMIHNDLHPPKKPNMVLNQTSNFLLSNVSFQGWINDESTYGECPVCLDESVSRYWSSWAPSRKLFQWWTWASIRCAKSIKVILGAKKCCGKKMGGGGNCSWWYDLFNGIQMDSRGFRKDVSHQTVKSFLRF